MSKGQSVMEYTKKAFKGVFRDVSSENADPALSEAAFPAYAHSNFLIDRLFWGRLEAVGSYLKKKKPGMVLDFGCGSGVMSHALAGFSGTVVMTDVEPRTFRLMNERIEFPRNVRFVEAGDLFSKHKGTFDVIVALDVLEHVENLPDTIRGLHKLLKPGGEIVISGPTENILYKIGRKIAGKKFTGDYHVSDIRRIEGECRKFGNVKRVETLYPLFPLFEIFSLKFEK